MRFVKDRFNARVVRRARSWSWAELLRRAGRVRAIIGYLLRESQPEAADRDDITVLKLRRHRNAAIIDKGPITAAEVEEIKLATASEAPDHGMIAGKAVAVQENG